MTTSIISVRFQTNSYVNRICDNGALAKSFGLSAPSYDTIKSYEGDKAVEVLRDIAFQIQLPEMDKNILVMMLAHAIENNGNDFSHPDSAMLVIRAD